MKTTFKSILLTCIALVIAKSNYAQCVSNPDSLRKEAGLLYEQEHYDEALPIYKKLLNSIHCRDNDTVIKEVADTYFHLGWCYYEIDNLDSALVYYNRALGHFNTIGDSLFIAKCYYQIGEICYDNDRYNDAYLNLQTSANVLEESRNTNTVDYGNALNLSGGSLFGLGEFRKATDCFLHAISVFRATAGEISYQHANSLNGLGNSFVALGEFEKGLEFLKKALFIRGEVYGQESNPYTVSLFGIAECYHQMGDYEKAIDYYTQTANIKRKLGAENSYYYAYALHGLGKSYSEIAQHSRAIEYYSEAAKIIAELRGKNHYSYATVIMNMADSYYQLGEIPTAIELFQAASDIYASFPEIYPEDHAWPLEGLGDCYGALGDYDKALQYYEQTMVIRENNLGINHPDYACSLYLMGTCYAQLKEYDTALRLLAQAKDIRSRFLLETNPYYIQCLKGLADIYYVKDMLPELMEEALNVSKLTKRLIRESFLYLPSSEREILWNAHSDFFFNRMPKYALKLRDYPEFLEELYDDMLFCKGLLLNTSIELKALIAESGDEEAIRLYETIQEKQITINRISDKGNDEPIDAETISNLRESINSLESELLKKSKAFGNYTQNLTFTWREIQQHLKKKDIAIEFIEIPISPDSTLYCSLSLKKHDSYPVMTELFYNYELEDIINKVENDTGEELRGSLKIHHFNESGYLCRHKSFDGIIYTYPELYHLVWGNLLNEFKNVKNVYFSPAGELYQLAIEYTYNGKHYLNEIKNVYRLSSTRQVLNPIDIAQTKEAALFGGITYSASEETVMNNSHYSRSSSFQEENQVYIPTDVSRSGGDYFINLAGTKTEVLTIDELLSQHSINTSLYIGDAGTEAAFKNLQDNPHVLIHVATHGFFWHGNEASNYSEILGWASLMPLNNGGLSKEDKEMTRTGLAFSGANNLFKKEARISSGIDDGILTAKEISTIDLRDTRMVILSACQTGLGEVSGEGVMGLQRGFKKAGAQTIIMSLWEVNDNATQLLMKEFYNQITNGCSTRKALSIAQKSIRKIPEYDCPYYWGAFIVLD